MNLSENSDFIGLGKTTFNTSVCHISGKSPHSPTIILTERLKRKKAARDWPIEPLEAFKSYTEIDVTKTVIAENRDVHLPSDYERSLNKNIPLFEILSSKGLDAFSSHFNPQISLVGHHYAHAMGALGMSPFDKALIVVMDGAGNKGRDLQQSIIADGERNFIKSHEDEYEEFSVYLQNSGTIMCVHKDWQSFSESGNNDSRHYTDGAALFYETVAEFVFNSKRAAGKVMGLAPFGIPKKVHSAKKFLAGLDWTKSFKGRSKKNWEESPNRQLYENLAATAQAYYEEVFFERLRKIKSDFPEYQNIILTGGTALNCVANNKLREKNLFKNIYVSPFPDDEGISYGVVLALLFQNHDCWEKRPREKQHAYWGLERKDLNEVAIKKNFKNEQVTKCESIEQEVSKLLADGEIVAWFQGRSEVGPRALGHRSLLVRPDLQDIKNRLNSYVKFREDFRPYGLSILKEWASRYFQVDDEFESPFMSFAVPVKKEYTDALKGGLHVDNTSRVQTVQKDQAAIFYKLIKQTGDLTGTYALLNTSLNIMGSPIVESVEDAKKFMEQSPVKYMAIGNHLIVKKT